MAALALPLSVFTGCGDDSDSGSDDSAKDDSRDDDDKGGEQVDARVSRMDGSTKNDAGSSSESDSGEQDEDDAGEETKLDSGSAANDGGQNDAAVDGMDAAQDASTTDAQADSGEDAKVDASEDSGTDAGEDAGQQDSGQDSGQSDAGSDASTDAGQEEYTEQECTENEGVVQDKDDPCADGQTTNDLVGDKICCIGVAPSPVNGPCSTEVACAEGLFCDYSTTNGGGGCLDPKKTGKCRTKPTECEGVFGFVGCGCDGTFYTNTCTAYKDGVPVEVGATAPCIK